MLRVFLLASVVLWAERPQVGFRVGWPVLSPYSATVYHAPTCIGLTPCGQSESAGRRVSIGLALRIPVTGALALRVMPAWQRVSFDLTFLDPFSSYAQPTTANRWELPVVAEWSRWEHVRPGVGAVLSVVSAERTISRLDVAPGFGTPTGYTNLFRINSLSERAVGGAVADIEFPFRTRAGTIAPDIRYTRWFAKHFGHRGRLNTLGIGLSLRY